MGGGLGFLQVPQSDSNCFIKLVNWQFEREGEKRGPSVSLDSAKPQTVNYSCLSEAITADLGNIWN